MERAEHRRIDHQLMLEEQRLDNARQAIANGRRAREQHTLEDLRQHFRDMRKGRPSGERR